MALIVTPGANNANSYISVADANSYFSFSYNRTLWSEVAVTDKEKALAESTRLLDLFIQWNGNIASDSQRLRWPRKNVVDTDNRIVDSNSIPQSIKDATCELAYNLLVNSGFDISENPVDKIKIGPISLDFDLAQKSAGFPKIVRDIISNWGVLLIPSSSGVQAAKLVRT